MYIDITDFVRNVEACDLSASKMELGNDAGKITWNNAKAEAALHPLFSTDAEIEAFRAWAKEFGAWDADEIAAWSSDECNALVMQYLAGDLRELESLCYSDDDEFCIDWEKAEELASEGRIGGNINRGDDGRLYFYMGS